jgi:hypothetical protein
MKRIIFLLLLAPMWATAQTVSVFDYLYPSYYIITPPIVPTMIVPTTNYVPVYTWPQYNGYPTFYPLGYVPYLPVVRPVVNNVTVVNYGSFNTTVIEVEDED